MASFVRGNQLLFLAKMFFTFSTIYALAYFWTAGSGEVLDSAELGDQDVENVAVKGDSWVSVIVTGAIDEILNTISYFSPFALIIIMLKAIVPSDLYIPINLLLLRQIGWIGAFITTEWVINKIRGVSE